MRTEAPDRAIDEYSVNNACYMQAHTRRANLTKMDIFSDLEKTSNIQSGNQSNWVYFKALSLLRNFLTDAKCDTTSLIIYSHLTKYRKVLTH